MKDLRYLVRINVPTGASPKDASVLLAQVKRLVLPLKASAMNLRVSTSAIEFDVFCPLGTLESALRPLFMSMGPVLTCRLLDTPGPVDAETVFSEARTYFNEERFWEVHEVLEGLWKTLKDSEKQWIQGVILVAAAFVHLQQDEQSVAWPMFQEGLNRLTGSPPSYHGWDLAEFKQQVQKCIAEKQITPFTV